METDGPIIATNRHLINLQQVALIDREATERPLVRLHMANGSTHALQGDDALAVQAELSKLFPRPAPPGDPTDAAASAALGAGNATATEIPPAGQPAANGPAAGQGGAPGAAPTAQAAAPAAKAAPVLT
jgi:hypothetical protein